MVARRERGGAFRGRGGGERVSRARLQAPRCHRGGCAGRIGNYVGGVDEIVASTPSSTIPRPTSVPMRDAMGRLTLWGRDFNLSDDGNTLVISVWKWNGNQGKAVVYEKDSLTDEWVYKCELVRNGGVPEMSLVSFLAYQVMVLILHWRGMVTG